MGVKRANLNSFMVLVSWKHEAAAATATTIAAETTTTTTTTAFVASEKTHEFSRMWNQFLLFELFWILIVPVRSSVPWCPRISSSGSLPTGEGKGPKRPQPSITKSSTTFSNLSKFASLHLTDIVNFFLHTGKKNSITVSHISTLLLLLRHWWFFPGPVAAGITGISHESNAQSFFSPIFLIISLF